MTADKKFIFINHEHETFVLIDVYKAFDIMLHNNIDEVIGNHIEEIVLFKDDENIRLEIYKSSELSPWQSYFNRIKDLQVSKYTETYY